MIRKLLAIALVLFALPAALWLTGLDSGFSCKPTHAQCGECQVSVDGVCYPCDQAPGDWVCAGSYCIEMKIE